MAMIRALWDLVCNGDEPNFNKAPYDLGSFGEIMHDDAKLNQGSDSFSAGCSVNSEIGRNDGESPYRVNAEFGEEASIPVLQTLKFSHDRTWVECTLGSDNETTVLCGVGSNIWEFKSPLEPIRTGENRKERVLLHFSNLGHYIRWTSLDRNGFDGSFMIRNASDTPSQEELTSIQALCFDTVLHTSVSSKAYASAPVRSAPCRTYQLSPLVRDIEGNHVPIYLAYLSSLGEGEWAKLKRSLERFGRSSGLFRDIDVRKLGDKSGAPFQIEIGLPQRTRGVSNRNLTDVGYGVSQALPILTELLHPEAHDLLLLQQPEVHLHPRGQAALGSLFGRISGGGRQVVVETHSDYIVDRVRMDVRDQKGRLRHEDVSILYFHRSGSNVKIHPVKLDLAGNIVNAPPRYRQFFMQELNRLLGC